VRVGSSSLRVEALGPSPVTPSVAMSFGRFVGGSAQIRRLYPLCERLAASTIPIVIEGETGTGKEVLAEAIHESGPRAQAPFVVYDCTAVAPSLVEATLFGHERGAFTGATVARQGVFAQASGGTLFIDEIGDLELSLQPKLLRALQRGEVQPIGASAWTRVDVRVIAATRRDLDREVQAGRFRDDLFFRLAVGRIEIPPLRSRHGDVGLLARHFWAELGDAEKPMPPGLLGRLEDYPWPGNVRELENVIARVLALGDLGLGSVGLAGPAEESPAAPDVAAAGAHPFDDILRLDLPLTRARQRAVEEFERAYVARVLERYGGNVRRAAAASGVARRYFQILRAKLAPKEK
jgi:two-component system, NtrC family, response regulator HydG